MGHFNSYGFISGRGINATMINFFESQNVDYRNITVLSIIYSDGTNTLTKFKLSSLINNSQCLCEELMSQTLSPEKRITRVWYVKTPLVTWSENHSSKSVGAFVSSQTLRDVINCCNGLVLYTAMLMSMFPNSHTS